MEAATAFRVSLLDFFQDTQTLVLDDHPTEGQGPGEVEDPFNANSFEVSLVFSVQKIVSLPIAIIIRMHKLF